MISSISFPVTRCLSFDRHNILGYVSFKAGVSNLSPSLGHIRRWQFGLSRTYIWFGPHGGASLAILHSPAPSALTGSCDLRQQRLPALAPVALWGREGAHLLTGTAQCSHAAPLSPPLPLLPSLSPPLLLWHAPATSTGSVSWNFGISLKIKNCTGPHYEMTWATCGPWAAGWTSLI